MILISDIKLSFRLYWWIN